MTSGIVIYVVYTTYVIVRITRAKSETTTSTANVTMMIVKKSILSDDVWTDGRGGEGEIWKFVRGSRVY